MIKFFGVGNAPQCVVNELVGNTVVVMDHSHFLALSSSKGGELGIVEKNEADVEKKEHTKQMKRTLFKYT